VDSKGKSVANDFAKVSPMIKCYRCQVYGHVATNCSSPSKIALINGLHVVESELESDKFTFQHGEVDSDVDEEITGDDVGFNCIRLTPSIHLSVVRCALSQPKEKDDWRRTTMFHTFTRIGGRSYKVIVDSGSCINAVSSTIIANFGLNCIPIETWINSSSLEVKQRCLVSIDFGLYKDKIWCDVVTMNVGHTIVGRP